MLNLSNFLYFINERENIRLKKEAGQPVPWTTDAYLSTLKFCNIRRKDDRVSRWIIDNILVPYQDADNVFFYAALARWINWPPTLQALKDAGLLDKWSQFGLFDWEAGRDIIDSIEGKKWTGAYKIYAKGNVTRATYVMGEILMPIWYRAFDMEGEFRTVEETHGWAMDFNGNGSFMSGQIVADLTYIPVLSTATDLYSWAPVGPGSSRGAYALMGEPQKSNMSQKQFNIVIGELMKLPDVVKYGLTAHDVQNCLCEFAKYEYASTGGRLRCNYKPKEVL